jgi:hypothetical protein
MKKNDNFITLTEGLGTGAYIFGTILIFFALIFLFIEMYITGIIILLLALFLIGYRKGTFIDFNLQTLTQQWGIFYPYVVKNTEIIGSAKSVVIHRHNPKVRTSLQTGPVDYHIEIELPENKVKVWEFYEYEKALQLAKDLAERLKVNFYQGSEINY